MSIGALSLLSGCALKDEDAIDKVLWSMSGCNDRVHFFLFSSEKLAKTYTNAEITNPCPFNAYYEGIIAPNINGENYRLELSGKVDDKRLKTISDFRVLPQDPQITRHVCVERWSAVGKWGGVAFSKFLQYISADLTAEYVGFKCADKYWTSIDMPAALHPQTLLVLDFPGKTKETKYGYPVKIRIPTKLGFKNLKFAFEIIVTNDYPGGILGNQGYNWFSGS